MISILEKSELEKLTTKRLLALKRKVFEWVEKHSLNEVDNELYNKYYEEYIVIKEILNTREHIER